MAGTGELGAPLLLCSHMELVMYRVRSVCQHFKPSQKLIFICTACMALKAVEFPASFHALADNAVAIYSMSLLFTSHP